MKNAAWVLVSFASDVTGVSPDESDSQLGWQMPGCKPTCGGVLQQHFRDISTFVQVSDLKLIPCVGIPILSAEMKDDDSQTSTDQNQECLLISNLF